MLLVVVIVLMSVVRLIRAASHTSHDLVPRLQEQFNTCVSVWRLLSMILL